MAQHVGVDGCKAGWFAVTRGGDIKRSGYGRELSEYGIRELVNIKSVWTA